MIDLRCLQTDRRTYIKVIAIGPLIKLNTKLLTCALERVWIIMHDGWARSGVPYLLVICSYYYTPSIVIPVQRTHIRHLYIRDITHTHTSNAHHRKLDTLGTCNSCKHKQVTHSMPLVTNVSSFNFAGITFCVFNMWTNWRGFKTSRLQRLWELRVYRETLCRDLIWRLGRHRLTRKIKSLANLNELTVINIYTKTWYIEMKRDV